MRQPLDRMRIRRYLGKRYHPEGNTFGMVRKDKHGPRAHQGWDLEAFPGTPVYAIANGVLTSHLGKELGAYCALQFIDRRYPFPLYAVYAHLLKGLKSEVFNKPSRVSEGELIALSGSSGNARDLPFNEMHLHFEIRLCPDYRPGLFMRLDPGEILGYQSRYLP